MEEFGDTLKFSTAEAVARLHSTVHSKAGNYLAMYSSVLGGIVTDPALMVLPLDDHMVHRGHGVFDTAILAYGKLYQLDLHLERFISSAEMARIPLPYSIKHLRRIIMDTVAASDCRDGSVRYWLSAGPGGFALGPQECVQSSFYVVVFRQEKYPTSYYSHGIKVVTSKIPIKPPFFARVKSTNYLPNVLMTMEAKDQGADNGIFIDQSGMIGESSNMNVAFVTKDRIFQHPCFDSILSGITVQRILHLAHRLVDQGYLSDILIKNISVEDAKSATEMFLIGSSIKVAPVVLWDNLPIGNGKPGPIARKLLDLWTEDTRTAKAHLLEVPYCSE